MISYFLTAKETDEFEGGEYPSDVTRKSEALLRSLEKTSGLKFRADDAAGEGGAGERREKESTTTTTTTTSKPKPPPTRASAIRDWLVFGGGSSLGGVEAENDLADGIDFIRTNRFELNAYYKPIPLRAVIAGFRAYSARRLRNAGFRAVKDDATGAVLWTRGVDVNTNRRGGDGSDPDADAAAASDDDDGEKTKTRRRRVDAEPYDPIVFLHGLGIGIAPYADWITSLPRDRPVVAPEWPNISYGADVGHRYPHPGEFADFLERATTEAAREARAALAEGEPKRGKKERMTTTLPPRRHTCDVIAHSYGTVVLTAFRRHHPDSVRRCVYVDPVCFLPSFGSYLRYGHDDHLATWTEMLEHLSSRAADPGEPMSVANLVLASWFVKGDANVQQLMKRLIFPHESWERGPLCERDMVVLSGLDDIVASDEIHARFTRAWPKCAVVVQPQWQHGGFLLEPDPDGVNAGIVNFATGSTPRAGARGAGAGAATGGVKRAWQMAFAKRKKRNDGAAAAARGKTKSDAEDAAAAAAA